MVNVSNQVSTQFSIQDQTQGVLANIAANMAHAGTAAMQFSAIAGLVTTALGAIGASVGIEKITEIGSKFEQTKIQIGGLLKALNLSSDFAGGLKMAEATMKSINTAAAKLPGEAEDYINVFKQGLPVVQSAIGGTVKQMTAFTNTYTATMMAIGVDSGQAASDLNRLLRAGTGGAGQLVVSWRSLFPLLKKLDGQANLTAGSFNKLTDVKRAALLQQVMSKMQDSIDAQATTWDAVHGTLVSNVKELTRLGSAPLFDLMKTSVGRFNELLVDSEGELTGVGEAVKTVGNVFSIFVGTAIQHGVDLVTVLGKRLEGIVATPAFKKMLQMGDLVLDAGNELVGAAMTKMSGTELPGENVSDRAADSLANGIVAITAALAAALGAEGLIPVLEYAIKPLSNFFGSVFGGIGVVIDRVSGVFSRLVAKLETTHVIFAKFAGMLDSIGAVLLAVGVVFGDLIDIVGSEVSGVLEGVVSVVAGVVESFMHLQFGMLAVVSTILHTVGPAMAGMTAALGNLMTAVSEAVLPALLAFGEALVMTFEKVAPAIETAINTFAKIVTGAANALTGFVNIVGSIIKRLGGTFDLGGGELGGGSGHALSGLLTKTKEAVEEAAAAAAGTGTRAKSTEGRGGGKTNQDFRYSHFDIQQKFAEGFDPDRIAVAFASDLGKLGEQKLQSNQEPLFGPR